MGQNQPTPTDLERPWYYQNWFLIASFIMGWPVTSPLVLWPVWAILILRSPWHNHMLVKSLAWAMLITGAVLVVMHFRSPQGPVLAIALILPGFLLTVITQAMWARYRTEHGSAVRSTATPADSSGPGKDSSTRRTRARRRVKRRRGPRSNRSSR